MPRPTFGQSAVQPSLVDFQFSSQGKDGVATLSIINRGVQKEEVRFESFELNGVESTTPMPLTISADMNSRKSVKLIFPGQNKAGYNQASYSYFTNRAQQKVDNSPKPTVLFESVGGQLSLRYDSDFSNRPLEVEILNYSSDNGQGSDKAIPLKIPVGRSVPVAISRPATVRYRLRLQGNKTWREESIYLEALTTNVGPSS